MKTLDQTAAQSTPRLLKLLLLATIFYIPNQSHFPDFSVTGLNITNLLSIAILLAILGNKTKVLTPIPLKRTFIFFFLVLTWGFLVGQVADPSTTFADLQVLKNCIQYMLLFFLAYYAVQDPRAIRLLFLAILFTTLFDVYLGLRQALDYGITHYNETRRVAAPFSWNSTDSNRSSAYYCIYLVLVGAAAFYDRKSRLVRWAALGILVLGVFVDFFTYSRQSYFILAALALILTFRRNVLLALIIAIALVNYHAWLPASAIARIDMTMQTDDSMPGVVGAPLNKELDTSTESRFIIWGGAAQLIAHNPWGVGLNHFERNIGTYVPDYAHYDAHNYYVLATTENGLLAPVALLMLLIGLFRLGRSIEKLDDAPESRMYGIGLSMAVLAVAMVNLYGSRFADGNLMSNFWIFAGLAARYRSLVLESRATVAAPVPAPAGLPARRSRWAPRPTTAVARRAEGAPSRF